MSLERIRSIETKYAVETIRSEGHQVWPLIRFSLVAYFQSEVQPIQAKSLGLKKMFTLMTQFFYGFASFFRRYEYLAFSDSSERKQVDNKWIDKSVDYIVEVLPNTLLIELPLPYHHKKSNITTPFVVSKLPIYGLSWLYATLFLRKLTIENEQIIEQVLQDLDCTFDYNTVIKRNIAQYKIGRLLEWIYRPKGIIIQCSYTNIGFTKAFKDSRVTVVEVQHGLITKTHEAYNVFKPFDSTYFPDYFLSYGTWEKKIFEHGNFIASLENVIQVGHFYLDLISTSTKTRKEVIPESEDYSFSVCITGQNLPGVEEKLVAYVREAAIQLPLVCFFYLPRNRDSFIFKCSELPKNFINAFGRNTYEVIRLTSYHSTIFSTCAIEALVLGTPNVLIDIDNLATIHLSEILENSESTFFAGSIEDYVQRLSSTPLPKEKVIELNSHLILSGYRLNVRKAIKKIFENS